MKRFILPLLLIAAISTHGQDNSISEFDLYGCWVVDPEKTTQDKGKLIYIRREESNTKLKLGVRIICFQAFDECKMISRGTFVCGNEAPPPDYGWTFEEDTGIVNIYSSKKWLKEFKERDPEEYKKFGSPEKFDEMKLKVVELADGRIGLEKLRKTKHSSNIAAE